MANAVVASWTACIKELQQLTAGTAQAHPLNTACMLDKLHQQPPLPHAAWKKLVQDVQVSSKLAALFIQQQPDSQGHTALMVYRAMHVWLNKAAAAITAAPGSRAAAAQRQQMQESQLLQHLGPAMDAAAAWLTAEAATLAAAAASTTTSSRSSNSSGSTTVPSSTQQDIGQLSSSVHGADTCCALLLSIFQLASHMLFPTGPSIADALPAAPAVVRLVLSVLQQQPVSKALSTGLLAFQTVAAAFDGEVAAILQSCPAANELLLMPEFPSCLAIMVVMTFLELDVSGHGRTGPAATQAASSSRGSTDGVGSSSGSDLVGSGTGDPLPRAGRQPPLPPQAGGSRVRLDSLTPLSCGLFEILGVTKETVQQAAGASRTLGLTTEGQLYGLLVCYTPLIEYQVEQAKGVFSGQLLLQLETDMLLHLAVLQLTASIPDGHAWPPVVSAATCLLCCAPLQNLWQAVNLYQLPQPAGYTGPQLALQLLPSLLGPRPAPELPRQQQQQQQQEGAEQQEPAEWCVLTPSAPLLKELLPLLIRRCRAQLRQDEQLRQQQQKPTGTLSAGHSRGILTGVASSLLFLRTLLVSSVAPAPCAAAAPALTAPGHHDRHYTFALAPHAQGALIPYAADIISICEAALRCDADLCSAATAAPVAASGGDGCGSSGTSAAAGAAGAAAAGAAAKNSADAHARLAIYADLLLHLCAPTAFRGYMSPLVLLANAAWSKVQRQLHSLLATMVKLSGCGVLAGNVRLCHYDAAAGAAAAVLSVAAAAAEQQQLGGQTAAEGTAECSTGYAAAVDMLASVVIAGRCCVLKSGEFQSKRHSELQQRQHQQHESGSSIAEQQHHQQQQSQQRDSDLPQLVMAGVADPDLIVLLSAVQQWLAAGSTCDQLAVAGYSPLPMLKQLEQLLALLQVLKDSPSDTAAVLAAAGQLQSIGLALCSFAVPCMCNNPGCMSMAGVSDLAAVSGRSCICAGCRVARYCGRACQRAAWKQHKHVCGALSAAAGGGAGVAGPETGVK